MRKKLLFVMPSLSAGGGERSLINLLSQIDYGQFEVDLFLLSHEGLFMSMVPDAVRILPLPESYTRFSQPIWDAVPRLLLRGKPTLAYGRIMYSVVNRTESNVGTREQGSWKYMARAMNRIEKRYDAAIGFLEKTSIYFCVEKVSAAKKIGWVHNDYDKLGMDPDFDVHYFKQLDHIVTVSDECASVLKKRFPNQNDKVNVIHNIVSPSVIRRLAEKEAKDLYDRQGDELIILSIGRLHPQKGFDLAVKTCKRLVERGYNVQWNIIGEGEEREKLAGLIRKEGLADRFKLLGLRTNPYPYLKQADIYAQTSRFEGKAIAVDEAKILNKPIVVTNFSTAKDQIEDGIDGLIVEMNADSVAAGIGRLIQDREARKRMTDHLSRLQLGTEGEIEKLYKLLG
ncbi:glycosyltransferase [Paenibacillus arenilitoris]|uniref:Glycosyltransferase n=1 Tax=Paenibacillus arenilitoris TaxID=2772299 RepID=A0A927CUD8_9BACL|nr:glycosyltransferase [Paenibacillus arenilitoris]MBD2872036.1 glycosyltransferase [Paenibacillus arenilitoris]